MQPSARPQLPARDPAEATEHLGSVAVRAFVAVVVGVCSMIGVGVGPISALGSTTPSAAPFPNTSIPATYALACADEGQATCPSPPPGLIPRALREPTRLTSLRPGESCPVTPGYVMRHNPLLDGATFGHGSVAVVIANSGSVGNGVIDLAASDVKGWSAFKTIWFSSPGYQGPFDVRAARLDASSLVALQDGAGLSPIVVPGGRALNQEDGWRAVPDGTYVKGPGCYGFEIDTLHSSEIVIIRAVATGASRP